MGEEVSKASNLELDDVLELITDFPVKPVRNKIIVTVNTVVDDGEENGVILSSNYLDSSQYVLASGSFSDDIKPGAKVLLDLDKMTIRTPAKNNSYESVSAISFKPIEVNGKVYALINDSVVDAIDFRHLK